MSKFEMSFIKDQELMEDINKYEDVWVVYGSVFIKMNEKKLDRIDNLAVFISYFYLYCLSSLFELSSGNLSKFEFEGLFELVFEAKESDVIIYLIEEDERVGNEIIVPFNDFAAEIFRSVDNYIKFVLDARPEFKKSERTTSFQGKIEEFRSRYNQTFR